MVQNVAIDEYCRMLLTSDRLHECIRGDPGNRAPVRRDKIVYYLIEFT